MTTFKCIYEICTCLTGWINKISVLLITTEVLEELGPILSKTKKHLNVRKTGYVANAVH